MAACDPAPAPYDADSPVDADDAFSPCVLPCGEGEVCRNLRCVRLPDAALDVAVDAPRADGTASPDAPPRSCCPIDPSPSCGCVRAGGTMQPGRECRVVCGDDFPDLWLRQTDVNGCPVWSPSGIACSDRGLDAGDDGAPDAGDDAGSRASDLGVTQ